MVTDLDSEGLVVVCDAQGRIRTLLRNDLNPGLTVGDDLRTIVDEGDVDKFQGLLDTTGVRHAAFDWIINVRHGDRIEALHFGAAVIEHDLIILAARNRTGLLRLSQDLMEHGPHAMTAVRRVLQESARELEKRSEHDAHLYDELSRLNNQLSTTQRQLIKANHELALANDQLQAFYEALPIGVVRLDAQGHVAQANARFFSITGCEPAQHWLQGVPNDERSQLEGAWQNARTAGEAFRGGYRRTGNGATTQEVLLHLTPLQGENGNPAGYVGVAEDASEARRLAEQARELERQADLRALTGGLAHHLNNIMTVVLSAIDDLERNLEPDHPLQPSAHFGSKAAQRAARLVRRLVIYSGVVMLPTTRFDVDRTVSEICERLRRKLPPGVELQTRFDAQGARLQLPRSLFEETIEEVLANALVAVDGRGRIEVATTLIHATERICISIVDNGCGMDAGTLRRVAEPFFTTREASESTGLGVPLADGFARHARGELKISSTLGAGTRVDLVLPRSD